MTAEKKEITGFQLDQWKEWYEEQGCYDVSRDDIRTMLEAGEDMPKTIWQEHHLSYDPSITVKIRKGVHQICGLISRYKSLTAADEGGLHFTIVNRLKFDLKKDVNVISTPSLKHLVTGNLIAINQTMVDALPEHIRVTLMESSHKDFRGLYELTTAYWVAKMLSNR